MPAPMKDFSALNSLKGTLKAQEEARKTAEAERLRAQETSVTVARGPSAPSQSTRSIVPAAAPTATTAEIAMQRSPAEP